jgi:hypothetical protein
MGAFFYVRALVHIYRSAPLNFGIRLDDSHYQDGGRGVVSRTQGHPGYEIPYGGFCRAESGGSVDPYFEHPAIYLYHP